MSYIPLVHILFRVLSKGMLQELLVTSGHLSEIKPALIFLSNFTSYSNLNFDRKTGGPCIC